MKKVLALFVFCLLIACKQDGNHAEISVAQENNHSQELDKSIIPVNPVVELNALIEAGEIEQAKTAISKYGVNYKDEYGETFFSSVVGKNVELVEYLLDKGYLMNADDKYRLYKMVKSDTILFANLYLKHIDDIPEISNAVFQSCEVELLEYYLKTVKPDISKCSFVYKDMSDINCLCMVNHCEESSVDVMEVLLRYDLINPSRDHSCIIENWIQGFPQLADSVLVDKLVKSDLIPETEEWTPLITYCKWNRNSIVEELLKKGYNPNWNNSSDLLYHALTRPGDGFGEHLTKEIRTETIKLLLAYGANPELDISIDFDGKQSNLSFVEFVDNWKLDDNTDLIELLKAHSR